MDTSMNAAANMQQENHTFSNEKLVKEKAKKNLMWFGIIGIIMMFSGLTSAVIVSKGGNFWVNINLPFAFWISSAIIITSSLTINLAQRFILKNNITQTKTLLLVTLFLGISFSICQFIGYKQLFNGGHAFTSRIFDDKGNIIPKGIYGKDYSISFKNEVLKFEDGVYYKSTGPLTETEMLKLINTRNTSSSYLYVLTFLHFLHVFGGLIYLLTVSIKAVKNKYSADNCLSIKLCGIYWHFLDLLWIYLFVFFNSYTRLLSYFL